MSKYTQDKWVVNSTSLMEVNSFKGIAIADCSMSQMINREEKAANAKLVAAAPDLLKAVKSLVEIYKKYANDDPYEDAQIDFANEIIKQADNG